MAGLLLHTPAGWAGRACPEGTGGGRCAQVTGAVVGVRCVAPQVGSGYRQASTPPHVGELVWSGVQAFAPPGTPRLPPSTPHLLRTGSSSLSLAPLCPGRAGSLWESCRENPTGVGSGSLPPTSLHSSFAATMPEGRPCPFHRVQTGSCGCMSAASSMGVCWWAVAGSWSSGSLPPAIVSPRAPYSRSPRGSRLQGALPGAPQPLLGLFRACMGLEVSVPLPLVGGGAEAWQGNPCWGAGRG